jgi:hypothetical protein
MNEHLYQIRGQLDSIWIIVLMFSCICHLKCSKILEATADLLLVLSENNLSFRENKRFNLLIDGYIREK